MTTNRLETKKYLPKYYTIHIYVYVRIQYIHTTINTIYYTKCIIQHPKKRITYKYKIRHLYPNKYNTQKTTYHILIPKHNTPNNHMIYKYEIRPPYPKKYNIQQKLLIYKLLNQYPSRNTSSTHNQKHHHTLHNQNPNHLTNSKHPQPHSKTIPQTKRRKYLKQIPHPTNQMQTKDTFLPIRNSHTKQEIHPNSKTYPHNKLHLKHNPHLKPKQGPPPKPKSHSNYKRYPKNKNKVDSAYRPRHKTKNKLNLTHKWKPNPITKKYISHLTSKKLENITPNPPITPPTTKLTQKKYQKSKK